MAKVLDIKITQGHLNDDVNSNNGSIQSADIFRIKSGRKMVNGRNGGYFTVADDDTLDLDAFSISFLIDFSKNITGTQYILDRASAGGVELSIWFSAADTLSILDGSDTRSWTISNAIGYGIVGVTITKASGASTPQIYIGNGYTDSASGTINISSNGQALTFLADYTGSNSLDYDLGDIIIDNSELTPAQAVERNKELESRKSGLFQKTNFYTAPSTKVPNSGSAWNMSLVGNKVIDQNSVNGYDGELTTSISSTTGYGLTQGETPWGEPCLVSDRARETHLTMGSASNLSYGSNDKFGFMGWYKHDASGFGMLYSFSGSHFMQLGASGLSQIRLGSTLLQTSNVYTANRWYLFGYYYDASDVHLVVNGEELDSDTVTGAFTGGTFRIGQYIVDGFAIGGAIGKNLGMQEYASLNEYLAVAKQEYNRVANKPLLKEDFKDSYIHSSTISSGYITGTQWQVDTGSARIIRDTVDGYGDRNVMEISSGGRIYLPYRTDIAGRYEFVVSKDETSIFHIMFAANSTKAYTDSTQTGYGIALNSNESVQLFEMTGGGFSSKFSTSSSYINADTYYKITVDVDVAGEFTTYVNDVLVTALSGSNPVSDTTVDTQSYIVFHSYTAASRISEFSHYFGKPQA